jgi:NADH dehydrogenase
VVSELLARGYGVRVFARNRAKARSLFPRESGGAANAGVSIVAGELTDAGALSELLSGASALINLIGIIREVRSEGQTFQRLHADAVKRLIEACNASGVRRFLQMSALGVKDVYVSEYQRTKFEGETHLRRSELDWTIFRPGMIHGVDGEFVKTVVQWCSGHHPPFVFLPYFTRGVEDTRVPLGGVSQVDPVIAPIYVGDVAKAFVSAIDRPQTHGEIYNLAGPQRMTWPAMLRTMRDAIPGANTNLQPFGIPGEVAALGAMGATLAHVGQFLPFDEGMARMGCEDSVATLDKVREDLGLVPVPFVSTFQSYAGQLGSHE